MKKSRVVVGVLTFAFFGWVGLRVDDSIASFGTEKPTSAHVEQRLRRLSFLREQAFANLKDPDILATEIEAIDRRIAEAGNEETEEYGPEVRYVLKN